MLIKQKLNYTAAVTLLLCSFAISTSTVHAAACNGTGSVGSVSLSVNVPVAGEYYVWVRYLAVSQSATSLLLDVAGDSCFSVGNASAPTQAWLWTNLQTNGVPMKYTFNDAGATSLTVYGMQQEVKVDKIMLLGTDEQCGSNGSIPADDGTNCDTGAVAGASGSTTTPEIVTANPDNVQKVEYYVDGTLVQTTTKPEGFDTTLVENGAYTLTTKVAYKDGTTAEVSQAITVENPAEFLGSIRRWARRNSSIVRTAFAVGVFVCLAVPSYFAAMRRKHKKLFLFHHGLAK